MRNLESLRGGVPAAGNRHSGTAKPARPQWTIVLLLLVLLASLGAPGRAQTKEWVWMGGHSRMESDPVLFVGGAHGARGVFVPGNLPGAREGAATWTDKKGKLWLFGGDAWGAIDEHRNMKIGAMNDLWEFDPATNLWAWMGGDDTVGDECVLFQNPPSANYSCGAPGVYGAKGVASPHNQPGARQSAASWTDANGNLWLFGGYAFQANLGMAYFNDLWKFDTTTQEWTWMGGSSTAPGANEGPMGVYGNLGVADSGNIPGGRQYAAACADASGNLWLFGGWGASSSSQTPQNLNDLWKYSPASGKWTWMAGSKNGNQWGVYGNQGTADAANAPGSRQGSACWADKSGKIWVFGGQGAASNGNGLLNDVWRFDKVWTWMGGSSSYGQAGTYGSLGVPGAGNIPSGRYLMARFTDASGNFWIFGGRGVWGSQSPSWNQSSLNDLWRFNPTSGQWTWMSGTGLNFSGYIPWFGVGGVYGTLGVPAAANTPGGRDQAASWSDRQGNMWLFAGEGSGAQGESWGFSPNDLWEYRLTAPGTANTATPTFSVAGGSYPSAQEVTIEDTTAGATIYTSPDPSSDAPVWTPYTGPIAVSASQSISAIAVAPGHTASAVITETYALPAGTPVFNLPAGTYPRATVKLTTSTQGATIYYTADGSKPTSKSTVYNGQIEVTKSETIRAIAVAQGSLNSAEASVAYTISAGASAANEWIWVGGDATVGSNGHRPGVYGTKGVANASNIPGSRYEAAQWTDKNGNLWLFGGDGADSIGNPGYLNDLWMYSPRTRMWTWVGGSNTTGTNGRLYGVYGSKGVFAAGNWPGGRYGGSSWMDRNGNFWLFGGDGWDGSSNGNPINLNDLWEFDPVKGQWAWITGPDKAPCAVSSWGTSYSCQQPGTYGALGVENPANTPGGRSESTSWIDASGNLWLFGGTGADSQGVQPSYGLNDLWKFDMGTKKWAWMGGDSTTGNQYGRPGSYGVRGTPSAAYKPGGRANAARWTDASGNLWLFGGYGLDANGTYGYLNDLWKFSPATRKWTWVAGDSTLPTVLGRPGVYGKLGVPAAGNRPGGRDVSQTWTDKTGNFWLLGGWGGDSTGAWSYLNDLWEYTPSTGLWTWMGGSSRATLLLDAWNTMGAPGVFGTKGVASAGNAPGGREIGATWVGADGSLWLFGGMGLDSTGTVGFLNELWQLKPTAPKAQTRTTAVEGQDIEDEQ